MSEHARLTGGLARKDVEPCGQVVGLTECRKLEQGLVPCCRDARCHRAVGEAQRASEVGPCRRDELCGRLVGSWAPCRGFEQSQQRARRWHDCD